MDSQNPALSILLKELGSRYAIPRKKAAEALAKIGTPAVIPLIKKLKDPNPDAQQAAAEALERIGSRVSKAAVEGWRRERGELPEVNEEAGV